MKDEMIRGTAFGDQIRFFAAYTKDTVDKARQVHDLSPLCTAALGRLLTAGLMMGAMGKDESDIITLKIDGDGPIKSLTVTADPNGNVKGLSYNNHVDLPLREDGHLDVGRGIGNGMLSVIRDMGMKEPYVGQTLLHSGEIAEDLTYYFAESEQIPTSVALGVLIDRDRSVKHSGGFIIQVMPFASDETLSIIEKRLGSFSSVTQEVEQGKAMEDIMNDLLDDVKIEDRMPVRYYCNCSIERVTKALISLGKTELQSMIDDGENIKLHCDFCEKDYEFTIEELKNIIKC